ncbi:hypothetical protein BH18ACI4_BH18ACI4_21910 [soil metagenome]
MDHPRRINRRWDAKKKNVNRKVLPPTEFPMASKDPVGQTSQIYRMQRILRLMLVEVGFLISNARPEVTSEINFYDEVRRFETNLIQLALLESCGHRRLAADLLGLKATTFSAIIKRHGIRVPIGLGVVE